MTVSDNPASRLHEVLTAFNAHANQNVSVTTAWAHALDVNSADVLRAVSRASNLLNETEEAVLYLDQPRQKALVASFLTQWSMPFFPVGRAWSGPSNDLITEDALLVLGGLGDTMQGLSPEGLMPDDIALNDLREAITEVIAAARTDASIPHDLRALMLQRLHDVSWAMDHVKATGPSGVMAATERLVGAILLKQRRGAQRPIVVRVMTVAARTWSLFTGVPEFQESLEGWDAIFGALPPSLG